MIGNDYTVSGLLAGATRSRAPDVQAGMRRQRVRMELWLDGELKARYQGGYVEIDRMRRAAGAQ